MLDITKINLAELAEPLRKHEGEWVAISEDNKIVSSAPTYKQAVDQVPDPDAVVLYRVTPADASISPNQEG